MTARPVTALAVCLLLVLSGCGATTSESTPTVTPVPVPELGLGPDGGEIRAPGLSTNGLFAPTALGEAHETALDGSRYRLVRTLSVRDANESNATGGLNRLRWEVVAAPGPTAYTFTRVERSRQAWFVSEPYARIDIWYRNRTVRNRFVNANRQARYWGQNRAQLGGPVRDITRRAAAVDDLAAVDLRVVGTTTTDGMRLTRLRATRLAAPDRLPTPPLANDPRNLTLSAVVDERGVIRRYTMTYDATFEADGRRLRVEREHRVAGFGTAAVGVPEWVRTANESVSAT